MADVPAEKLADYLENEMSAVLQEALADLWKEKPEKPLAFLGRWMLNRAAEELVPDLKTMPVEEAVTVTSLLLNGQEHLFKDWPAPGQGSEHKTHLLRQLVTLNEQYDGGLGAYICRSRRLLEDSHLGRNPLEGWVPSVPVGKTLDVASEEFKSYEKEGCVVAAKSAFVLVAGGLGERLGYSGIKVSLPVDLTSNKCYLQHYAESILALQETQPDGTTTPIPLVIMTSDDTHAATEKLIGDFHSFGMAPGQIQLLKQNKVGCLVNNNAQLALVADDRWSLLTKPHGHGDIHTLLYRSGLPKKWAADGREYVVFFQDTNALIFKTLPAALGVSKLEGYGFNSICVPRKAGEAVGGICELRHQDGRQKTINVEYNVLGPLLRSTPAGGDVNSEKTGFSPFPGNCNQLIVKATTYTRVLEETKGIVPEFVNPKYADVSRSKFKSAARLETLMQDFPHLLSKSDKVGFTVIDRDLGYSPVKNALADARIKAATGVPPCCAGSGEMDLYAANRRLLELAGVQFPTSSSDGGGGAAGAQAYEGDAPEKASPTTSVDGSATAAASEEHTFGGITYVKGATIVFGCSFAKTCNEVMDKFKCIDPDHPSVFISTRSTLMVDGPDVTFDDLILDGALIIKAVPGAKVKVCVRQKIKNEGFKFIEREPTDMVCTEVVRMRAFDIERGQALNLDEDEKPGLRPQTRRSRNCHEFVYNHPGEYVLEG